MQVKELKELLNGLSDSAEVTIVDADQNYSFEIIEGRTTDGNTDYIDLVVDFNNSEETKNNEEEIMDKEKAERLFVDIAEQFEECEEIIDRLRSLNSNGQLTDEEYNYIQTEWDNLLEKHGLMED